MTKRALSFNYGYFINSISSPEYILKKQCFGYLADLKTKKDLGPGLKSYKVDYDNSFFPIGEFIIQIY